MFEALDATQFGGEIKENDPPLQQKASSVFTSVQIEILKTLLTMQEEIVVLQKGNNFCQEIAIEDTNTKT